jgi:hypothetical protein
VGAGGGPHAAARLQAEQTVLAMLSPDDFDRPDVVTALAQLKTVYAGERPA